MAKSSKKKSAAAAKAEAEAEAKAAADAAAEAKRQAEAAAEEERRNPTSGSGVFAFADGSSYEGEWAVFEVEDTATTTATTTTTDAAAEEDGDEESKAAVKKKVKKRHGRGVFKNGGDVYDGEWKEGRITGQGKYTFASGAVYEGEFVENAFHGRGLYKWPNGCQYDGDWVRNRMHGQGCFLFDSGDRWQGTFRQDQYLNDKGRWLSPEAFVELEQLKLACRRNSPPRIIIAGAPASGKGTQCEMIKEEFGVVHFSTGDALRAAVKAGTDVGVRAKSFMDQGQLVPDDVIIALVKETLTSPECVERGWLLDGFPRTKAQADALHDAGIDADVFVLLDVPTDILVERVVGRRTDPETGKIYHMTFSPPESEDIAARLVQRSDDTEEKIKVRVSAFQQHVDSIVDSYAKVMEKIDGNRDKHVVFDDVKQAIRKHIQ